MTKPTAAAVLSLTLDPAQAAMDGPSKEHKAVTVTVAYDESDRNNVGWAYWATYNEDGEPEGSGSLNVAAEEDEESAVREAQALYPHAKVVVK